jgi:hypothetical protein
VKPRGGEAPQARPLARSQPRERLLSRRQLPALACAARLDLHEYESLAVERDQVDLAIAGAGVALDDREAEPLQVRRGQLLAEASERVAGVFARGV